MTERPVARWAEGALVDLSARGLRRHLEPLQGGQGARVTVGGRSYLNFSSNDYLGLAGDAALARRAAEVLATDGLGSGASRLVVGDSLHHRALEAALADWLGAPAALVFNGGYAANLAVIGTLVGPGDVVFSDALNHASIIDGCRLSRARVVVVPHADPVALEAALASNVAPRRLVVTESIFSMDGDAAPLEAIVDVCERHDAALYVDEAHALGVRGPEGAGLVAELGLADRVDLRMGTLGKAVGAFGAFVAAEASVVDWLVNRARPLIYATSLPPAVCAGAQAGVERIRVDPGLRAGLLATMRAFATGLHALGLPANPASPIFPIRVGTPDRALRASARLRDSGFLVKPIRPPTVPEGTSRLRVTLSAAHSPADLDGLLHALADLELAP
jgi:8-amino-7-oxononanoate synthase